MTELSRVVVVLFIAAVGYSLARRGTWQFLAYALFIIVFNRGLRRILDYYQGGFSSTTIISTLPLVIGLLALPVAFKQFFRMPQSVQLCCGGIIVSVAYGFALGALSSPIAAVYSAGEQLAPLFILLYAASIRWNERILLSFGRWIAAIVVFSGIYGIYQFYYLPEWDRSWMVNSEMGSLGRPVAQEFRVFSFYSSPGPAATMLAGAFLLLIVFRLRLGFWSLCGSSIVGIALLLTSVRSAWLMLIFAYFIFAFVTRNSRAVRSIFVFGAVVFLIFITLPYIPGSERVFVRFFTFSDLDDDISFRARLSFVGEVLTGIASNPLGEGLGSVGTATRLQGGGALDVAFDNGYLYFPRTYGILFGPVFLICYLGLIVQLLPRPRLFVPGLLASIRPFALALSGASLLGLLAVNVLQGTGLILTWIFIGVGLAVRFGHVEVGGGRGYPGRL